MLIFLKKQALTCETHWINKMTPVWIMRLRILWFYACLHYKEPCPTCFPTTVVLWEWRSQLEIGINLQSQKMPDLGKCSRWSWNMTSPCIIESADHCLQTYFIVLLHLSSVFYASAIHFLIKKKVLIHSTIRLLTICASHIWLRVSSIRHRGSDSFLYIKYAPWRRCFNHWRVW